jgi:hypothetical protein
VIDLVVARGIACNNEIVDVYTNHPKYDLLEEEFYHGIQTINGSRNIPN